MSTMQIGFGILFLIGGLALAVLLGIVLYRDPKQEARKAVQPIPVPKDA